MKIYNQFTEENRTRYFHSLLRSRALQTFKNISISSRENLAEILAVFHRTTLKPQSMAATKHKFQRLVLNPLKQKLVDLLDELQKLAKDSFGHASKAMTEQSIDAEMRRNLKKSNT